MASASCADKSLEPSIIGELGNFVSGLSVRDSNEVENGLEMSGTSHDGQEVQQTWPKDEIRKLFVASIDKRVTNHTLQRFFCAFGPVQNAHVARKADNSRLTFGFVTFYKPEDASSALKAGIAGLKLMGRILIVKTAERHHQPRQLPNGRILWNPNRWTDNRFISAVPVPRPAIVEEIDETKCFVRLLNDDCLMHIFSFLDKRELIRIENVCKRWQTLSIQMWRSTKKLDFDWLPGSGVDTFYSPLCHPATLTTHIFTQVLDRCGPNIQSLDLSHRPCDLNSKAITIIAEKCPNLYCLNMSYYSITSNFAPLHSVSSHLQHLVLNSCCKQTTDTNLGEFFKHCSSLVSLSLIDNPNLSGACLASLSADTLIELFLDNCYGMQDKAIVHSLAKLKNLKKLSMNGCLNLKNSVAEDIFKALPQLEEISLSHRFPLLQGSGLASLSFLTELTSLTLYLNAAVNDEVLQAVARCCKKLKYLDISGCSVLGYLVEQTVTDAGIEYIAELPNLTNLKMSYMALLSNQSLGTLAEKGRLQSLECRGCPTISDFGCERIICLCSELERFDLSGVNCITNLTVNTANAAVKLRTNNVKLTLIVGGTDVDEDEIGPGELDPLLNVDFTNLCIDHHRPDFIDDVYFMEGDEDVETDDDFDLEYDDEIGEFDLECQAMFVGDDLADFFKFQVQHGYFDNSDSDLDDDDLNFMAAGPYLPG